MIIIRQVQAPPRLPGPGSWPRGILGHGPNDATGASRSMPHLRRDPPRRPEPHILLFRRALGTDPTTGRVDARLARAAVEKYRREYEV